MELGANLPQVFTYGSQLESKSARMSQPGDFFVYLIFVGISILVSDKLDSYQVILQFKPLLCFVYTTFFCHLAYLPAQPFSS